MGPAPRSTVLTPEQEAIGVAFRRHTLLALDDCLYALQSSIPGLTRSSLHRCFQRHGISRLPELKGDQPAKKKLAKYPIGYACEQNHIEHRLTQPGHPWTNGQVERMNRTLKAATVKRYCYENHQQLKEHLHGFLNACNYAKRLKTLHGLTPYEYIIQCRQKEPDRFNLNPHHHKAGLNTSTASA